ncbi:MAG: cellulase family glycosylhydrolase [Chthoniobacteraceae bacterium]|nr:cellulase family glycosylhydrolase [Chthoniobacteraceae bacterium]
MRTLHTASQRALAVLACMAFAVTGAARLHAQNTDSTDTAPGGATSSLPSAAKPKALPAATPVALAQGVSLISNSDFSLDSQGKNWPDGWGKGDGITWESENGKHFLRLTSQRPGQMLMAYREIPVKPDVKAVELSIRYRTAGIKTGEKPWFDARTIVHFLDAGRKPVKPEPGAMVFAKKADDWTIAKTRFMIPEGTAKVQLMPSLFQVAEGRLDFAEIRMVALDNATVTTMSADAAAAEKKKGEQKAVLDRELARPAKAVELKVSGNKIVTPDGTAVWLQGVNIDSLEWNPNGDANIVWSAWVALTDWNSNVLRVPVNDDIWFGRGKNGIPNDPEKYRQVVDTIVKLAATRGAHVILDLHRFLAPSDANVAFWKDAAVRYKNNPAVIYELFNEPHGISWEIWRDGGMIQEKNKEAWHSPGMQALVNAIRETGAKNIILAGGLGYSLDLTGIANGFALDDKGGNGIVYGAHFYNWHKDWQKHFLFLAEKYPILVGEFGADIKKMNFIPANDQEDPYTWVPDALGMIQKYKLHWTAFSFHTRSTPVLLSDWDYTPTPFWGAFAKDALNGKQFQMKRMR